LEVGVPENERRTTLRIFPNPNSGPFTLSLSDAQAFDTLEIHDALGRCVYREQLTGGNPTHKMDPALPSGAYLVRVRSVRGATITARLLVL
jgi:hypothetical protein